MSVFTFIKAQITHQYAEIYGFARLITEILILKSMNGMREFR